LSEFSYGFKYFKWFVIAKNSHGILSILLIARGSAAGYVLAMHTLQAKGRLQNKGCATWSEFPFVV